MIFKLLVYVLSHGCLLTLYKEFFNFHTWFYMSCASTPTGCKCLFVVYAFFLWEASCYESCCVSHDVSIYCILRTSFQVSIPHPRHHSSCTSTLLPFLPGYFFIAVRLCINDVSQQCHITVLCPRPLSFFESIVILFFILDYFSNCRHLFFGISLILLLL